MPRSYLGPRGSDDLQGRTLAMLVDGMVGEGRHEFAWDGRTDRGPAPAGIYLLRLETREGVSTRRFALFR